MLAVHAAATTGKYGHLGVLLLDVRCPTLLAAHNAVGAALQRTQFGDRRLKAAARFARIEASHECRAIVSALHVARKL